jgi:hypothetical protein
MHPGAKHDITITVRLSDDHRQLLARDNGFTAFEQPEDHAIALASAREPKAGSATATQAPPASTLTVDAEFPAQYAYEVLVFDVERERRLVAAVEIISPANKDRPESRLLFVSKCLNLLRHDVCVSMIDLVTICEFNLYTELLALLNRSDPTFSLSPAIYAVTSRKRRVGRQTKLDTWSRPLAIGQPLPALPVWLSETETVSLDLVASYEETSRVLRIP